MKLFLNLAICSVKNLTEAQKSRSNNTFCLLGFALRISPHISAIFDFDLILDSCANATDELFS